jgi:hypothetical protein
MMRRSRESLRILRQQVHRTLHSDGLHVFSDPFASSVPDETWQPMLATWPPHKLPGRDAQLGAMTGPVAASNHRR